MTQVCSSGPYRPPSAGSSASSPSSSGWPESHDPGPPGATFIGIGSSLDRASAADSIYLARLADFDRLMQVLAKVKKEHNVRNTAVALSIILDTFEASK